VLQDYDLSPRDAPGGQKEKHCERCNNNSTNEYRSRNI